MNIYAKPGTKVRFTANGGYDSQIEDAKQRLELGAIYTIAQTYVGYTHTTVWLKECPGVGFNSCLFEDV